MKINKARMDLLLTLGPLLVIVCFILILYFPKALISVFYLHWIFLAFAFILMVSPWGKKSLDIPLSVKPLFSVRQWLGRLFGYQICLMAVFLAICELIGKTLPVFTTTHTDLFTETIKHLWINFGIFPWAMISIVAICIGYVSYHYQQDAFMHNLLMPIVKSGEQGVFGLNVNSDTRLATLFAFSCTFALSSLIIAALISKWTRPIATGLHPGTLLLILLLILLAFTKPFKKFLLLCLSRKYPLTASIIFLMLLLALIIVFLNEIFHYLNQTTFKIPFLIEIFQKRGWQVLWLIFAISFWIAWIPITSMFIARISRGYRVDQVISATLLLPIIFTILLWINLNYSLFHWHHEILSLLLGLAGFIGLLIFITGKSLLTSLIWSYLPKSGMIKSRDHHFFFRKCLQISMAIIYIYLPTGIIGLSVMGLVCSIPFAVISVLIGIALILHFRKNYFT